MDITFTGRHQGVTESLKSYLTSKLERVIKNIPKVNGVHVIIDSERFQHKVEVLIHLNHRRVRAAEKTDNLTASMDQVVDKLERQLKKYKDKLQYHRTKDKGDRILDQTTSEVVEESEDEMKGEPKLIRSRKFAVKPMDPGEASMQLKLVEDNFLVFLNSQTNCVNVIYKRKDGNFGLIEPRRVESKV